MKKLVILVETVGLDDIYFDCIVRDVCAMCPALECFEFTCNSLSSVIHSPTVEVSLTGPNR